MPLILPCSKCGGEVEMSDEAVKEALTLGQPVNPQHESCPNKSEEPTEDRTFHLVVTIHEVFDGEDDDSPDSYEEKLAQFGETLTAKSFKQALEPLAVALNKQWEKVQENADVIDG